VARIAGVDLPKNKKMGTALTYIYGIGPHSAMQILKNANVDAEKRTEALSEDDVAKIRDVIEQQGLQVEGDLRRRISIDIKRLMDLGCYRGLRHRRGLPVRGQRTHSNARTRSRKKIATRG
jgi:small subunit ribosomal protein S13